MAIAYSADKIFTGNGWIEKSAVVVDAGRIEKIVPLEELPSSVKLAAHGAMLAPSFIDIQLYGAHSKLFAVYPQTDTLEKIRDYCQSGGAKYFLPTLATNSMEVFYKGIDAIRAYWKEGGSGVLGLHVEGPWINPEKKGAHIASFIHSPTMQEVTSLVEYGRGVIKVITLAPEVCDPEIIDYIQGEGIIVSAGHSNGTFEQINEAFDRGVRLATHLFNAMSPLHHRKPGFPAAVLLHPTVMASIVADGYHVDFSMIKLAKKLMGERLFLITDAVTETREGPYPHHLVGEKYESNGILSGSALTLLKAVRNCIDRCGISLEESLKMAGLYPARALAISHQTGKIAPGFNADMVMLDESLHSANCI
ncbi:MAG: N-acetylglucosamine-6-phosphate deacetylase [Bacteroidota bacterium]|nr:N-acetylglucosamine-6-phosphate deacetylase [Bacteroidota bacterium]